MVGWGGRGREDPRAVAAGVGGRGRRREVEEEVGAFFAGGVGFAVAGYAGAGGGRGAGGRGSHV